MEEAPNSVAEATVPAVPCSVIQYCSDIPQPQPNQNGIISSFENTEEGVKSPKPTNSLVSGDKTITDNELKSSIGSGDDTKTDKELRHFLDNSDKLSTDNGLQNSLDSDDKICTDKEPGSSLDSVVKTATVKDPDDSFDKNDKTTTVKESCNFLHSGDKISADKQRSNSFDSAEKTTDKEQKCSIDSDGTPNNVDNSVVESCRSKRGSPSKNDDDEIHEAIESNSQQSESCSNSLTEESHDVEKQLSRLFSDGESASDSVGEKTGVEKKAMERDEVDSEVPVISETSIKQEDEIGKVEIEVKRGVKREAEEDIPETLPKKSKAKSGSLNGEVILTPSQDDIDDDVESDSDEEFVKPRKRGRNKKNPDLIPPHLAPDIALGYRMLLKFLETPLFAAFLRPCQSADADTALAPHNEDEEPAQEQITCLNQIRKKFDDNSYKRIAEFVADVRAMLSSIYMQKDAVAVKRALRLEQVLEQRIAQLPNYLRPQCVLNLSEDEVSNSPKKIRIHKGGGFVSLLLERAEKIRVEKDREKRKVLAEGRKQLKEEQDKDVQDWEKNVLLKDHEEDIKSMWELPQIGHFIHLCADILNIGHVSQYEVERMLLTPQCSETLDLIVTALLSNSLMRAKLDRTPSMPYSIWLPLVRTRVNSWYRAYQREFQNAQKIFEEIGVEPEFWQAVGPDHSPLDYFNMHEIPLIQRVWILKTLCDVDFVRKKTVYDNIRQQLHEELQGSNLGVDRHGNRYIHFPQFVTSGLRIYRQSPCLEEGLNPADLVESQEGFDERSGEITLDKVLRDIWEVGTKLETPVKRGRKKKKPSDAGSSVNVKVKVEPTPPKSLRQSARAKRVVVVDESDSDCSDTDLATLKTKLNTKPEKTFISLTVFRLPRDKVKPVNVKKSYYCRKLEREEAERQRLEELEANKDKVSVDDDASESNDRRIDDDDDDDAKDNFTVKNLENLKMVLKKEQEDNDNASDGTMREEDKYRYSTPSKMLPDRSKFYCVVDSVDGLRQLITQFASDENDLEIINRSNLRSGKKASKPVASSPSCEVQLIERLQKLLVDLEAWEMDFIKNSRTARDKMHKEYISFAARPEGFVHPNEAYWQQVYEEPAPPPPPPPPADPEPPPEIKLEVDAAASTLQPASPLGSLRPRTRTRQSQQLKLPDPQLGDEEIEEEYLESSGESDDNWEMPQSKRRMRAAAAAARAAAAAALTPGTDSRSPSTARPKRSIKKNSRYSNAGDGTGDKSQRAMFCRSSDPSEELNWEANRQKILEKHNSPKKVLHGDIEGEMSELENSLRTVPSKMLPLPRTSRILPPPIPGNKKPYFPPTQPKTFSRKKDNDVEIIGQKTGEKSPSKPRRVPSRTARTVVKKTAGTQSGEVIDVETDNALGAPTQTIEQFFVTDGTNFVKIDADTVQVLIKNQDAVRKFSNELDLNKKIQIVKKKLTSLSAGLSNRPSQNNTGGNSRTIPAVRAPNASEPTRPHGLRLIRPQNVPTNQAIRPTQRVTAPQNMVYVQTSQAQGGLVQLQQGTTPGMMQVVRAAQPSAELVQVMTRSGEKMEGQPEIVNLVSSPAPGQPTVGFIQVQTASGNKQQPLQFVQASQASGAVGQDAAPALGQNVIRVAASSAATSATAATQYVRLASTGQLVQLSQQPSSSSPVAFSKQQMVNNAVGLPASSQQQSAPTGTVVQSQSGPVNLMSVQGLAGEGITYLPLPAGMKAVGNIVQIQGPIKGAPGQMGAIVQVASGTPGTPPMGRILQVQGSPRLQQPAPRPQSQMVQIPVQRPAAVATQAGARPSGVQTQSGNVRPQTTLVQVYATPRMQAATATATTNVSSRSQAAVPIQVRQPVAVGQQTVVRTAAGGMVTLSQSQLRPTLVPMTQNRMVMSMGPAPAIGGPSGQLPPASQSALRPSTVQHVRIVGPPQQGNIIITSQAASPRSTAMLTQMSSGGVQTRPSGPQMIRMQTAQRPSSPAAGARVQSPGTASRPQGILAQTLTTGVRPAPPRPQQPQQQFVTQVPISGKPGFYQLQNAEGQTISIVQVVGPGAAVGATQSGSGMMQLQGVAPARPHLLQVQQPGPPSMIQMQQRPQIVQLQGSAQSSATSMVQIQPRQQLVQMQPASVGGQVRSQLVQMQTSSPGGQIRSQLVQVQTSSSNVQMRPQIVQMQSPAGSIVQMQGRQQLVQVQTSSAGSSMVHMQSRPQLLQVQLSPSNVVNSSSIISSQGSPRPQYVQVHSSQITPNNVVLQQSGNRQQYVQVQTSTAGSGMVHLQTRPQVVQVHATTTSSVQGLPSVPSAQPPRAAAPSAGPARTHVYTIEMDEQPSQCVRLVTSDARSGQPVLLRTTTGARAPASSPVVVSSTSQPVTIKIDEDDDEIKIVPQSSPSLYITQ